MTSPDEGLRKPEQPPFGSERAARPDRRTHLLGRDEARGEVRHAADGEAEHRPFKKVPADMQPDRQPEVAGAQQAEGEEHTGQGQPYQGAQIEARVAEMGQRKEDRRNGRAPGEIQALARISRQGLVCQAVARVSNRKQTVSCKLLLCK